MSILQVRKKKTNHPLRQATLCFLTENKRILLAMKKRGFGKGKWNGVGGKVKDSETIKEAVIRETYEEIKVNPLHLMRVAKLDFYFLEVPEDINWNQQVTVYLCKNWKGAPKESEEMKPQWFSYNLIPYEKM
jgi:8-oxo-dGTP pyrophosphatase MutT (NUDIX family)